MIENPMVSGLPSFYARQDAKDAAHLSAYLSLRDEMIDALLTDPAKIVQAPGYPGKNSAADVVADDFASAKGDAMLHEALRIIGLCATGKPGPEGQLRASAWIAGIAAAHAAYHVDDLVDAQS